MQNIPLNQVQSWMTAIRLRTLPIPTIQVLVGTGLAYAYVGNVNWLGLYVLGHLLNS